MTTLPTMLKYPPNNVVSHRVLSSFPQLVSADFRILHLPKEVILFACQAIQILELSLMQKLRQETKPMTEFGEGGAASARTLLKEKILCLTEYQEKNPTFSYSPSLKFTGNQTLVSQDTLLKNVRSQWSMVLLWRLHALWSRQCGSITGGVPSMTRKVPVNLNLMQASKVCSRKMISTLPSTKSQKAITPACLRCMAQYTSLELEKNAEDHMANLIIGAFFFAMRSCKYALPKEPGQTITIRLGGVTFFDIQHKEINQNHPHLLQIAVHVRLLFEDQKNKEKCERK